MSFSASQTLYAFLIVLSTRWTLFFGSVGIYDKLQGLGKVPRVEWIAKLVALLKYVFIIISVGLAICVLILSTTLLIILLRPTGGQTPIPPTVTQTQVNTTATAQAQANATATAIAIGPPTNFSVTTITLKNGHVLQSGQPIPITGVPLTITGTDTSQGSAQVWVVVEDTSGNSYLQHPPVRFDDNGQWTARNIVTAVGTVKIDFVYVTSQGNKFFEQMVVSNNFGPFTQLPDGSKILQTIPIVVSP
jgi:hypothetical protein